MGNSYLCTPVSYTHLHFVKPDFEYGGKNKDNGKLIVMYSKKGRKPLEREVLYDEE